MEYYTPPTQTNMVVDDHFVEGMKEINPEMVTNQVKNKIWIETCQILLITISSSKLNHNLDKTKFIADSIQKTVKLVSM